jgi:hypothetical protein
MNAQAKVIGLTVLILVLTGAMWGMGYYWHKTTLIEPAETQKSPTAPSADMAEAATSTPLHTEAEGQAKIWPLTGLAPASSTQQEVILDLESDEILANPFKLSGQMQGYSGLAWQLQDAKGQLLGQGMLTPDAQGKFADIGWYEHKPTSKTGTLLLIEPRSASSKPVLSQDVKLQTRSQTVEIYLLKPDSASVCPEAVPVKRSIVATDGDSLNYYEATLHILLQGPDGTERKAGWTTAIPTSTRILKMGQDDKGRYIGDFSDDLLHDADDPCLRSAIRSQISETLTTIYSPGLSLKGRIFINGQEVQF